MKRLFFRLLLLCLTAVVGSTLVTAQPVNQLGNPGFESPGFDAKDTNFTLAYPWQDDGTTYVNTGVENVGAHSGIYRAFEMSSDDGAYQITSYKMNSGDVISLSWWAMGTYNGSNTTFSGTGPTDPLQIVGLISAGTTGDAFNTTTNLTVTSNGLPGGQGWIQYTLNYTAQAGDAGRFLGCYFNTQQVGGNSSNSFGAYDDFYLAVLPAGSVPAIVTGPSSQSAYTGATVTFNVSAIGATSYQWKAGTVGSGVYTNIINAGQFSGATTTTLIITNVTTNNDADYVVVVSNGNGSVTSTPPATLTVATILYQETFNLPAVNGTYPDQVITAVGWMNDITSSFGGRVFTGNQGYTAPDMAVYSFDGSAATEAFYGTTASINGGPYADGSHAAVSNRMAFPGINLQVAQNVGFIIAANGSFAGNITTNYVMVQMNFGQWYISTNFFVPPADTTTRNYTFLFDPSASAWNLLTVSGHGSDSSSYTPVIGGPASSSLTGYITGIGWVCAHGGSSTANMDTYTVTAAIPPSTLPQINSPPFGTTNYTGTTAQFAVTATSNGVTTGLTYQWKAGTVGSGIYTNVPNSGQFSGATSPNLTVSNVSAANHKDFVVVVADGAGSVTSVPPATLTIVDSPPLLTSGALVYPNNANNFSSTNYTLEAGNNNVMTFTASFVGDLPISYHWQYSATNDGTGVVTITGTTSSSYTLPNPQPTNTGYYRVQASNSQSVTPTNSGWAQLTVLPAANAFVKWSAAVPVNGLTESQILGLPGTFVEAESFYGASVVSITNGGTVFNFDNTGAAVSTSVDVRQIFGGYTGPTTGDTNFDAVLGTQVGNVGGSTITLNNLLVGTNYTVQLFALNDTGNPARQASFSDAGDAADVSPSFAMGDNAFVTGSFTATNTTQVIIENEADGNGYIGTVIVRQVSQPPPLSIQSVGSSLQVTYGGTLLQATSVNGPWVTNSSPSPYTFTPTGASMFFRSRYP